MKNEKCRVLVGDVFLLKGADTTTSWVRLHMSPVWGATLAALRAGGTPVVPKAWTPMLAESGSGSTPLLWLLMTAASSQMARDERCVVSYAFDSRTSLIPSRPRITTAGSVCLSHHTSPVNLQWKLRVTRTTFRCSRHALRRSRGFLGARLHTTSRRASTFATPPRKGGRGETRARVASSTGKR